MKFPEGFLWGAATASYQVEGGIDNCDWAQAGGQGRVPQAGKAIDHYNRFEGDFDIAQSLSHSAHRFSLEWARIEPEEGKFDQMAIEHYRNVIRALKDRGLVPFVTLWHFTLPLWFSEKGGFSHPDGEKVFARYCEFVIIELGSEATYWMTMNEPLIWASGGHLRGVWPPFHKNLLKFIGVISKLANAHNLAYTCMKRSHPEIQIGIAKHNMYFDADAFPWNIISARIMRWFWNHRFLKKISGHQDFIGLNFYIHKRFGTGTSYVQTEMGWDIFPEAFYSVLFELKRYNLPVYVTENGIADSTDDKRGEYIATYLQSLLRAIESGVNIRGYFYWSLFDNFEWALGFEKRFGLVAIDYNTLERTIRPSAHRYTEIILKNEV